MTQVFISYSRRDLAFVEQLASDLKAVGLVVWYDLSRLEAGDSWPEEIQSAIGASDIFIIVISPDSIVSKWVRKEFLYASSKRKKSIPLLYKKCDLPLWLLDIHFIDIQGKNYKRNYNEILRAMGVQPVAPKKPPVPEKAEPVLVKPVRKEETPELKKVRAQRKWDSKNISMLVALIALSLVLVFGLPPLLPQAEDTPVPALITTDEPVLEPTATATIIITTEPSSTPTEASTPTTAPLSTEISDEFGVEMMLVPAGEFTMGSDDIYGAKPAHMIFLDAYYIDKYEVTNALYKICVDAKVCDLPRRTSSSSHYSYYDNPEFSNYPVMYINWFKAKAYCEWRGARLPTEAEWEKAARGTDARTYPWGEGIDCKKANYAGCVGDAVEVGRYESGKSPYGIYDMVGNVSEWVADWYSETYYQNSPVSNPFGPEIGEYRGLRGGYYSVSNNNAPSSQRFYFDPEYTSVGLGFRCARDANLLITPTPGTITNQDWKPYMDKNQGSTIDVQPEPGTNNSIRITFNLLEEDWAAVYKKLSPNPLVGTNGLTISYRGHGAPNTIEVKLIHTDDTVCKKVIHNKTNTSDRTDRLEISYRDLVCEAGDLNLDNLDRIDLSFSNWPNFGDEPGEGEVFIEMIQLVP